MKFKIQFIARNIPTPDVQNNDVIFKIAHLLTKRNFVDIVFPKEYIPYGFQFFVKFKKLYKLKDYELKGFSIKVLNYIRIPLDSIAFLFLNNIKIDYFLQKKADLIHGHFIFPDGLIAQKISKQMQVPYIVTVRKSDWLLLQNVHKDSHTFKAAKKCLDSANCVHVHNGYMADLITAKFSVSSYVIPHGVDKSIFELNMIKSQDRVIITCVAGFISLKNIDWVIKSVINYNGTQEVVLKIIGDGVLRNELVELSAEDSRIRFLGQLSHGEVLKHMASSNIFALPSSKETFGLVYMEAAATANAIIAFNKYSINGVFSNEESVFVSDFKSFETNIHYLINNPEVTVRMGILAQERAKKLTWEKVIEKYEEMYSRSQVSF